MLASLLLGRASAVASAALQPGDGSCTLPHWPPDAEVQKWPHDGEREKCFCAYSQLASGGDISSLTAACPSWPDFVSTDGVTPDRVHAVGASATASATVLGSRDGNATAVGHQRYGPMSDWAIDLGSGYGNDCDTTLSPGCAAVGTHLLSIPRARFYLDCCTHPTLSLAAALRAGEGAAVCATLREMVGGALAQIQPDELASYDSCRAEDEEPALPGRCLAQCFHIVPDVYMAHLHTTAAAARQRNGRSTPGSARSSTRRRRPTRRSTAGTMRARASRAAGPTSRPVAATARPSGPPTPATRPPPLRRSARTSPASPGCPPRAATRATAATTVG